MSTQNGATRWMTAKMDVTCDGNVMNINEYLMPSNSGDGKVVFKRETGTVERVIQGKAIIEKRTEGMLDCFDVNRKPIEVIRKSTGNFENNSGHFEFTISPTSNVFCLLLAFKDPSIVKSIQCNIGDVDNDKKEIVFFGKLEFTNVKVDVEYYDLTTCYGNIEGDIKVLPLGYCVLNSGDKWSLCPQVAERIVPHVTKDGCTVTVHKTFRHTHAPAQVLYMVDAASPYTPTSIECDGTILQSFRELNPSRKVCEIGIRNTDEIHVNVTYKVATECQGNTVKFDLPYDIAISSGKSQVREVITMDVTPEAEIRNVEIFNGARWLILTKDSFNDPRFPNPLPVKVTFK